jgi:hypothetical protein
LREIRRLQRGYGFRGIPPSAIVHAFQISSGVCWSNPSIEQSFKMIDRSNMATTFAICSWAIALTIPVPSSAMDGSMGFSVDVSLSSSAAAKLNALKEKIVVSVLWYGEPTRAARKRADEMGQIDLGTEQVRLPSSGGQAEITGRSVQVKHIDWVKNRAVQVNVNVFSARLSGPDNYLDCGAFEDTVVVARSKPVQMVCKLIGEQ